MLVVLETEGTAGKAIQEFARQLAASSSAVKGIVAHNHKNNQYKTLSGIPFIEEDLMGLTFRISPASFFQVNTSQIDHLYGTVLQFAELDSTKIVLDTYCGIGTLSLIAAKHALKVYGIECVPQAIIDAKENAIINDIDNAEFRCGKTEDLIAGYPEADVVILNPPRQGCEASVFPSLEKIKPRRIVYVSCDPATLARDLAILQQMNYGIDKVQPVDMFPQTMHVETVVKLTLN